MQAMRALVGLKARGPGADSRGPVPIGRLPSEIQQSAQALRGPGRSLHGGKFSLAYFPQTWLRTRCADRFGYLSPPLLRAQTKLPFTPEVRNLLAQLGGLMANSGRETSPDSVIPAGYTYVGQLIDHDITLDVSSSLEMEADATSIHNMRTPVLDLDSVYGRGPALQPYLYESATGGNPTAIKLRVGTNTNTGRGGSAGASGNPAQMQTHADFDVPRTNDAVHTALIGDPRNDENLIVVQLHHAMLRFHNAVVDLLIAANFTGDIFVEAKRLVTQHYQWAVLHDFLERRICGSAAVADAITHTHAPPGSPFRMPVEFSVAAFRMGHSMVRDRYWVNFNFPNATMDEVFRFNRPPNLPVFSNWVVDWNAFLDTGKPVPVHNKARKLDSTLANQLEALPGMTGMMAVLATRNLLRGAALGLPSGQGLAAHFGVPALTEAQLISGLPADEVAILQSTGKLLLQKTPLWYYILREAAVIRNGESLGPLGARVVADTFVRMLRRDADSILNVPGGFTPSLPSLTPGDFTFADLVNFAGVTGS
jgi:hypothetical protein